MKIGALIAGRYRIERLAGTGGMGSVYQARDLHRGILVAVKLNQQTTNREHTERFSREARALAELLSEIDHPGIVEYIDHGATVDGIPYLVIEWLEGRDLKKRILEGTLSESQTLSVGVQLCSALHAVHSRGIIHRDIKPTNLFLPGGDLERIKLIDFGLVRIRQSASLSTQTGQLLGTPTFMPPEQARGARDLDARVDIYSMGAVLFSCLAGRPPFVGEHPMAVLAKLQLEAPPRITDFRPDVSPATCELVLRLLAKKRADRPASVDRVADRLRAIQAGLPRRTPTDGGARGHAPTVSSAEQRFTSILLIGTTPVDGESGLTPDDDVMDLLPLAERYGASIRYLPAGMVLVSLSADTGSVEVAVRAARFALALRDRIATIPMTIATGRESVGTPEPVGEAIDRAIALLPDSDATLLSSDSGDPLTREQLIVIDEVTGRLLDGRFDIDFGMVPGGHGSVLRAEAPRSSAVRALIRACPEHVGRKRELTMLHANFEECIEESVPRVVLITGPPGIGKSRLAYEFIRGLDRRGQAISVWAAYGDAMSAGAPFGSCAEIVRQAFSLNATRSPEVRAQRVLARCRSLGGIARPEVTAAFLTELCTPRFDPDETCAAPLAARLRSARSDARLMHDCQRQAWEDWLRAETASAPVVLLLDDVQWSDPASVSFVHTALRNLEDSPLMVLALARPEIDERFPALWPGCAIERSSLKPLSRKLAKELSRLLLGPDSPDADIARLAAQAEGNPLFMQELALSERSPDDALPRTVLAYISARLARLSSDERLLLRAASVMGSVFWHGALVELTGFSDHRVEATLRRLAERDLLIRQRTSRFSGDVEYAFHHELVRQTAYATLPEDERRRAHKSAGHWLQERAADNPLALAQHFARSGDLAASVPFFAAAATHALEADDLEAAVAWSRQAMDNGASPSARARMLLLQAEAYNWRGQHELALAAARRAMSALDPGRGDWAWAAHQAFWALSMAGAVDELEPLRRDLIEHLPDVSGAPDGPDERYLIALAYCCAHLLRWGRDEHAAAIQQILASAIDGDGDSPVLAAVSRHVRLVADLMSGRLDRAAAGGDEVIAQWLAIGHQRQACLDAANVGEAWLALGAYEPAAAALESARKRARRLGSQYAEIMAVQGLAMALAGAGDRAGARALLSDYESATMPPSMRARMSVIKARVALLSSQFTEALGEIESALAIFGADSDSPETACSSAVRAQVLLALGRSADALDAARIGMEILDRLGHIEEGDSLVRLAYAEALRAEGRADDARAAIARARAEILSRAERIAQPDRRLGFTQRVAENRRILELWSAWTGESG